MSVTPDVTDRPVLPLSSRMTTATFEQAGARYDLAIDDLPFMLAPSQQHPYARQTAQSQRQQVDTSAEPGEQSLSQWWTRSQDSWHRGAGIGFYEPGTTANNIYRFDATTANRFEASVGIDPWTKGQLQLIRKNGTSLAVTSGQSAFITGGIASGVDVAYVVQAGVVKRWDGTTATTYTNSGGTPLTGVVRAGSTLLAGTATGIISGSSTGSTMANLWTIASGATVVPYWVKNRVIAARGPKLYELTLAGGSIPLSGAMEYTHPDANWTWTGVVEAPTAILAAGYSNGQGLVYRFDLVAATASGGSPTIGSAQVVAEFPPGEEVTSIYSYLGTYLAIGTSAGVRIGAIGSDASINYGPLVFTTTKPVRALTAQDRFVYAAVESEIEGSSGAFRIDLSQMVEDLRPAYAADFNTHVSGVVSSIGFLGNTDRVMLGVTGSGIYLQSATLYEPSGWLTTGKIRYGTSIGKIFTFAQIRCTAISSSTIRLSTVVDGVENFEFSIGQAFNADSDIALSTNSRVLPNIELKLTLGSSANNTVTPTVDTVTLKALPQMKVQRNIQYPINLSDFESDRNGIKLGWPGAAWERLRALESKEESRGLVTVKDMRTGEVYRAFIAQLQFSGTVPPDRGKENFGGFVNLTMTKL